MSRAVVLGAGFGGLVTAAALRGSVDEVVLVERDRLPDSPAPRTGVPQAAQLHNLLSAAQVHADGLLPGFVERMVASGAVRARVSADTYVHEMGVRMPERDLGLSIMSARRPLLEEVAREVLLEDPTVGIEQGVSAVGLRFDADRVAGVVVRRPGTVGTVDLAADLVVDATGTGTAVPGWLAETRHPVPVESDRIDRWHAAAVCRRPPALRGPRRFWLVFPTWPNTRGGLASPIDDEYLHFSLNGHAGDRPPRTTAEYTSYAGSLEDPVLGDLLDDCEWMHGPALFRIRAATWHHYEQMDRPVVGLLPVGDAVATLNPLFGQGMSVVATQAAALAEQLRVHGADDLAALSARHREAAAAAVRMAWELGTVVDSPGEGWQRSLSDPARAAALSHLVQEDGDLHRTYVSVWHLLEPAAVLDATEIRERIRDRAAALAGDRGREGVVLDR